MVFMVVLGAAEQQKVTGALVDVSDHGFRARHVYAGFQTGDIVSYIHRTREGIARVIWQKAAGSDFETGFSYFEK